MARDNTPLYTFNRGRISRLGLARVEDLERTRLSAEKQTNWVPRTLGSMMLRPGLGYIDATPDNKAARMVPFIFSTTDTGLVVVTDTNMSVLVDDTYITRTNSTATISGGEFTSTSLSGWTDADETNSTSEWISGNYMGLTGTRFNRAIRRQSVSASSGDHGLSFRLIAAARLLRSGRLLAETTISKKRPCGLGSIRSRSRRRGPFMWSCRPTRNMPAASRQCLSRVPGA